MRVVGTSVPLRAMSLPVAGLVLVGGLVAASAGVAYSGVQGVQGPVVGVAVAPDRVAEESGEPVVVTLAVGSALSSATDVTLDLGVREGLAEYDVFRARLPSGVRLRAVDAEKRQVTLTLPGGTSGPVPVEVPVFDDPAADGEVVSTWTLVPGPGYEVDPGAAAASVTIVDADVDARPSVPDASYATAVGALLSVPAPGVLAGASDPEGRPLTAAAGSVRPGRGSVTVQPDGAFTYRPEPGFSGQDRFSVRASDGNWTSVEALVTVTVAGAPTTPATTSPAPTATTTTTTGPPGTSTAPGTTAPSGPAATLAIEPATAAEVGPDGAPQAVSFRVALDTAPAAGESVTVYVRADVEQALTQLDLFGTRVQHDGLAPGDGPAPIGDFFFTGFTIELVSSGVTITVPTFDDGTPEPATTMAFSIVPFGDVPWGGDELGASPPVQATGPYRLGEPATATLQLVDRLPGDAGTGGSTAPSGPSPGSSQPTATSSPRQAAPPAATTARPGGRAAAPGTSRTTGVSSTSTPAPGGAPIPGASVEEAAATEAAALPPWEGGGGPDPAGVDAVLAADAVTPRAAQLWLAAGGLALLAAVLPASWWLLRRRGVPVRRALVRTGAGLAGLLLLSSAAFAGAATLRQTDGAPVARAVPAYPDDAVTAGAAGTQPGTGSSPAASGESTTSGVGSGTATTAASAGPGTVTPAQPAQAGGADPAPGPADPPGPGGEAAPPAGDGGAAPAPPAAVSPDLPVVSVSVSPASGVEEDRTTFTVTVSSSRPPPAGGLRVELDSPTPKSLAEFDVFAAQYDGLRFVLANSDSSGFVVQLERQSGTIRLPLWDDDGSAVEAAEGVRTVTYSVQDSDAYDIDPAASSISITISDRD